MCRGLYKMNAFEFENLHILVKLCLILLTKSNVRNII